MNRAYIEQYEKDHGQGPACATCGKPVPSTEGFHCFLMPGSVSFQHWGCNPSYSAKIDMLLDDAHSESSDGLVEVGHEVFEKRHLNNGPIHYHTEGDVDGK